MSICFISGDGNFDHAVKVVSAGVSTVKLLFFLL